LEEEDEGCRKEDGEVYGRDDQMSGKSVWV